MKQPTLEQRKEYTDIERNSVSVVPIEGTKKSVKIRWMHPYTIERLTDVWIERDLASARLRDGDDVARDLCKEPYFAFKEAALIILNNDIKIRLFYGIYWRYLAFRYTEHQMVPIIVEGKKKVGLLSHYETMAYSMDMRTDLVKMTKMEAEQYQAERLSASKLLSSKSSPLMAYLGGVLGGGSEISGTGAS